MLGNKNLPKFGPLSDVKILAATQSVAGSHGVQMLADYGADVVWIENPRVPDLLRSGATLAIEQEHRNQRTLALDIPSPEGKEILLKMVKDVDMLFEVSKGGQWKKWGLTDEVLWEHNPALVIVHISGFGQDGVEEYVTRASYDPLAQAFSGYMRLNGFPDRPGIPAAPFTGDYFTGQYAALTGLAALHNARATGQGESVDVAQYEVLLRTQAYATNYLTRGEIFNREGSHSAHHAGYGTYACGDGNDVYLIWLGGGVIKRGLPLLGLEYGSEMYPERSTRVVYNSPAGQLLEEKLKEFCLARTSKEVEDEFKKAGVPCGRLMNYPDLVEDPHVQARNIFVEWEKPNGQKIKGVGVVPKLKNNPGQTWRGTPDHGMDNEEILLEIGYTQEQINELYDKNVIGKISRETVKA